VSCGRRPPCGLDLYPVAVAEFPVASSLSPTDSWFVRSFVDCEEEEGDKTYAGARTLSRKIFQILPLYESGSCCTVASCGKAPPVWILFIFHRKPGLLLLLSYLAPPRIGIGIGVAVAVIPSDNWLVSYTYPALLYRRVRKDFVPKNSRAGEKFLSKWSKTQHMYPCTR
jgi:hypothetical protein